MKTVANSISMSLAVICLASCGGGGSDSTAPADTQYSYKMPEQRSDGWAVDNVASEGIDLAPLASMMRAISFERHDSFLKNILIVKNNKLVFEEYFGSSNIGTKAHMQSATKSIVSTIFGIAKFNGYVGSVDDALFDYFPEYSDLNNADKQNISLHHALTMTPGLDWNEGSTPLFESQNDNIAAYASRNYIQFGLRKELVDTPGASWNYNSACPMFLAGIVKNQTGIHLDEFGENFLFAPLGIQSIDWQYQNDGLPLATGGLSLKPRDIAKIGQLFLDEGRWQGQQIVDPAWVQASLTAYTSIDANTDYGYLWWTRELATHRLWYASGYGGQYIFLIPAEEVMIVINANYTQDTEQTGQRVNEIWNLLANYILPSIN